MLLPATWLGMKNALAREPCPYFAYLLDTQGIESPSLLACFDSIITMIDDFDRHNLPVPPSCKKDTIRG